METHALERPDLARIVALDLFTGNSDRHDDNLFYDRQKDAFHGIDHGNIFGQPTVTGMVDALKHYEEFNPMEVKELLSSPAARKNAQILVSSLDKLTRENPPSSVPNIAILNQL